MSMLQEEPKTERVGNHMAWIKENFSLGNIITLLLILSAIFASAVRAEQRDSYQEQILEDHEQRLRLHEYNRDIHLDVRRDELWRQELTERLRRIEAKLDR